MIRKTIIAFLMIVAGSLSLPAQDNFYDTGHIPEIRIAFKEANWQSILDSLFINYGDKGRLKGDVTIDGTLYKDAGIRYKGYSSWDKGALKNPFNIDLDYSVKNRNHQGYVKLKLSNVINDPSFVREVLSYEIARKYLPEPKANFANVYINDTLIGLYTNVEAVGLPFALEHYGSETNCMFKGEPAHLQYPVGQNANLALTHGSDSSGYEPYYKLESDYGWKDIYDLIYRLDKEPDSAGDILNIDRTLWMHAFNYTLLNLDSYIGYSQNYYMYRDDNGQFNPIIWDLNMSFGSFRESDGSTNFRGLSIAKMKTLDPLEHLTYSVTPRPLMTGLFKNDTWRRMYLAHIRTLLNENITNNGYYQRAQELQSMIDGYVRNDPNKFYSYADFKNNLDSTAGGTGSMILYPGLKDLMENRAAYLATYPGITGEPSISDVSLLPDLPEQGGEAWITARITGAGSALLAYRYSTRGIFRETFLYDDGQHNDGDAGDGIYGARISDIGHTIQYYLYAENDSAGIFSPEGAGYEYYSAQPVTMQGDLVINEVKASADPGKSLPDHWIELLNTTSEPIGLSGFSLAAGESGLSQWEFPDTVIRAKSYLAVMTADNTSHGLQAGFSLPSGNGVIRLLNNKGTVIDSVLYGNSVPGKSIGRYPNGYGSFTYMIPSFSMNNFIGTTPAIGFSLYPNPARSAINIEIRDQNDPWSVEIINTLGKTLYSGTAGNERKTVPVSVSTVDLTGFETGIYIIKVTCGEQVSIKKFIVY